jgi:hypothetical protein
MRTLFALACAAGLLLGSAPSGAQTPNECGCYQDATGCKCTRKAKCGCPGECEPVGCEAKREKQAEKEATAELRRIAAKEKKKAAEAAKAAKEKEKAEKAAEKAKDKAAKEKPKGDKPESELLKDLK